MSVVLMYSKCLSLRIDRADVVESRQKNWNTVCIFHAWRRRLAHMLGIASRMAPRALSGAPVGTTGIGNVATLDKGGGWGTEFGKSGGMAMAHTTARLGNNLPRVGLKTLASAGHTDHPARAVVAGAGRSWTEAKDPGRQAVA